MSIATDMVLVAVVLVIVCAGCGSDGESEPEQTSPDERHEAQDPVAAPGEPRDLKTVRRVHRRYGDSIDAAYSGVTGHGVGAAEPGSSPEPSDDAFAIVVFLNDQTDRPGGEQSLAGVPLRFEVSGSFEALPAG